MRTVRPLPIEKLFHSMIARDDAWLIVVVLPAVAISPDPATKVPPDGAAWPNAAVVDVRPASSAEAAAPLSRRRRSFVGPENGMSKSLQIKRPRECAIYTKLWTILQSNQVYYFEIVVKKTVLVKNRRLNSYF
ncbi:hypothetical protein BH09PSE4_BH09PSE4_01940 [soil metagenome]